MLSARIDHAISHAATWATRASAAPSKHGPRLAFLRRRSVLVKLALSALLVVLLFTAFGFLAVPAIIKSVALKQIATRLHRQASIASVSFNPYTLEARVRGFVMNDRTGSKPAVAFDELYVNGSAASVRKGAPIISAIRLVRPRVSLVREESGRYNFADIVDQAVAQPESEGQASAGGGGGFALNNLQLTDGTIELDDRLGHAHHAITDLNIAVPFISNLQDETDVYETPHIEGKFNGEPFELTGRTKPFKESRETTLEFNAEDVDLPRYLEYAPVTADFKLASATLNTHLEFTFLRTTGQLPAVRVSGTIGLSNVSLTEPDGRSMLKLPALDVRIAELDLARDILVLDAVRLQSPEISVRRSETGAISLARLASVRLRAAAGESAKNAPALPEPPQPQAQKPPPFTVQIKDVAVSNGAVNFDDRAVTPPFTTRIAPVEIGVQKFSYPGKASALLKIALASDQGAALKLAGAFDPTSLSASGSVELTGVAPRNYASYWRNAVGFDLDDGVIDAGASYDFHHDADVPSLALSSVHLGARSLRMSLRRDKSEIFRAAAFNVADGSLDLTKHVVAVGQLTSRDGAVSVRRSHDGVLDVTQLLPAGASSPPAATEKRAAFLASGTPIAASTPVGGVRRGDGADADWTWTVGRASLEGYSFRFEDQVPDRPVVTQLEPVSLSAESLSSQAAAQAKLKLRARINKTGSLDAAGSLSVNPLAGDFTYDVKTVDLVPYQPYVEQLLAVVLSSGQVSTRGTIAMKPAAGSSAPQVRVRTSLTFADFTCTDAVAFRDLLRWKTLNLSDVSLGTAPLSIAVNEIALSEFYSRLILNSDGRFNLQGLVRGSEKSSSSTSPPQPGSSQQTEPPRADSGQAEPPSADSGQARSPPADGGQTTRIGRISLQGGNISYTDLFIKPNFSANLTDVTGMVAALAPDAPADVDLRGKLNGDAPIAIAGKIDPLGKSLYLDVKADARDIQLSPLTPYSEKYVGYGIEKGTLSLKLAYKVENGELQATNNVYLDQLTFGEKSESPDALKLPVLLAVALLKDRNGVIQVDLPISGSLNDPDFSVGGIIVRVITNLLLKAVTSPFALLSSVFSGSGEELSYIEFDPGRAALTDASTGRLQALAQALRNRPALKLDITGRVDPEVDREALRRLIVERSIRAQKFNELAKAGTPVASVNDVTIPAEEYPRYLTLAYRAASFPKPRNAIGLVRDLPAEDMKNLMLENTKVDDAALRSLAERRAEAAHSYLVTSGSVESDRIFLVDPKLTSEGIQGEGKSTRVDFALR